MEPLSSRVPFFFFISRYGRSRFKTYSSFVTRATWLVAYTDENILLFIYVSNIVNFVSCRHMDVAFAWCASCYWYGNGIHYPLSSVWQTELLLLLVDSVVVTLLLELRWIVRDCVLFFSLAGWKTHRRRENKKELNVNKCGKYDFI